MVAAAEITFAAAICGTKIQFSGASIWADLGMFLRAGDDGRCTSCKGAQTKHWKRLAPINQCFHEEI
jgi:hypothetical protein